MAAALAIAAGTIGAAYLAKRSSDKATKAATESNTAALDFTKRQAELAAADYQRRYDTWLAERNALMSRYGISVPSAAPQPMPTADTAMPRPASGAVARQPRPGVALVRGNTIADMLGMRGGEAPAEWNDWSGYGLRPA